MIVTIHQPNFVPWLPYFEKMRQCDVFVVMGHCQFEKNGFQNRFFYQDKWRTMSVVGGLISISEKQYVSPQTDWLKIKRCLPHKEKFLSSLDDCMSSSLFETNTEIIRRIAHRMRIESKIVTDAPTELTGTERLVEICKQQGATKYVSGPSGRKYLNMRLFEDAGIEVVFYDSSNESRVGILDYLE